MSIVINVTAEDIAAGAHHQDPAAWCPIAQALRRKLDRHVSVGAQIATVFVDFKWSGIQEYTLSKRAQRFVRDVDKEITVEPSRFVLREVAE